MTNLVSTAVSFDRILVPSDLTDTSELALEYAKRIAKSYKSQL